MIELHLFIKKNKCAVELSTMQNDNIVYNSMVNYFISCNVDYLGNNVIFFGM